MIVVLCFLFNTGVWLIQWTTLLLCLLFPRTPTGFSELWGEAPDEDQKFRLCLSCLAVDLRSCYHLLLEESSLMTEQDTNLWVEEIIVRNHSTDIFLINSVCFCPRSLYYQVSSSWPFKQYRAWDPSPGMNPKVNHVLVNYCDKFCTIIALAHLQNRTDY